MKFVYLIRAGNEYKVGVASDLKKRLASIQTSNAQKVELVCARRSVNAQLLEKSIHKQLKIYSGNGGREWFSLTPTKALEVAIKLNKTPEVETADLIIEDLSLDLRKVILNYWENVEREMRKGGALAKPEVIVEKQKSEQPNSDETDVQRAIDICRQEGKASTSLLQRKLSIGYGRASRIMDKLQEMGVVSEPDGSKPRKVLA